MNQQSINWKEKVEAAAKCHAEDKKSWSKTFLPETLRRYDFENGANWAKGELQAAPVDVEKLEDEVDKEHPSYKFNNILWAWKEKAKFLEKENERLKAERNPELQKEIDSLQENREEIYNALKSSQEKYEKQKEINRQLLDEIYQLKAALSRHTPNNQK